MVIYVQLIKINKQKNPENGKRDISLLLFLLNTNIYKELFEKPLYKIRFNFYITLWNKKNIQNSCISN